jgi:hypothetical protein
MTTQTAATGKWRNITGGGGNRQYLRRGGETVAARRNLSRKTKTGDEGISALGARTISTMKATEGGHGGTIVKEKTCMS